jgi:EmrB/QacA subfamily drug resistance transporter
MTQTVPSPPPGALPARAAAHGLGRAPWLVLLALAPGIFLALADATVMSIAVPSMIRDLNASVIAISWVMNGYNLVLTVLFLTCGRLADRLGHRALFAGGLALFTAASVGCALSGTVHLLIAFRVLQAVGAAAVIPTALAMLLAAFPPRRQGLAAGLFGAVTTGAAAVGPVIGGLLIQRWSWPAIFWFNVPVGTVGVALVLWLVPRGLGTLAAAPETADAAGSAELPVAGAGAAARRPLDWTGVGLVSAGLFSLTLALIQGNEWGWRSSAILGLLAMAALLLVLWARWELRAPDPLFDLRLFRRRAFAAASVAIMTVDVALMGTAFMLVIFMNGMMDYRYDKAGAIIAVLPAAALLLAPVSGRLVDRFGPRWPAVGGALLSAAGLVALGHLTRTAPPTDVLWRAALVGAGLGLSLPALTAAGMSVVPGGLRGAGAGMLNTARQLGFLLGVALLVAVFAHTMHGAMERSADRSQTLTEAQTSLSPLTRHEIVKALDSARTIDATAGIAQIRKIAHPVAAIIAPHVGPLEALALLGLKNRLEAIFWDEVSAAFRLPFYIAALAAVIGALAGALLPARLPRPAPSQLPRPAPPAA